MRKKIITTIFMIALVFALSFTLAACGKKDKPTDNPAEYTITFDSKGGSAVKQIKAKAGDEIKAPDEPTKSGFEFLGWFESTDGGTTLAEKEFAINYMPAKNITLYAKWEVLTEKGKTYTQTAFIVTWISEEEKLKQLDEMFLESEEQLKSIYGNVGMTLIFANDRVSVNADGYGPEGYSKMNLYYTIAEDGVITFYESAASKEEGKPFTGEGLFENTFIMSSDYKSVRINCDFPATTEFAFILSISK